MTRTTLPLPSSYLLEQEYQKLVESWTLELRNSPHTNMGSTRLQWSRLMDRYLNQQWSDSQLMLHHAQNATTEAAQTTALFSLRMMQRSIDARQEMIDMLCDLGSPQRLSKSPPRAGERVDPDWYIYAGLPSSDDETQVPCDEHTSHPTSSSSSNHGTSPLALRSKLGSAGLDGEKQHRLSPPIDLVAVTPRLPPRFLAPSPSTPTFSTTRETVTCHNNFQPLCNYNRYWRASHMAGTTRPDASFIMDTETNADSCAAEEGRCHHKYDLLDKARTCMLCDARLSLKKSFSADDVQHMKALGSDATSSVGSSLLDFPIPASAQVMEDDDRHLETQLSRMAIDCMPSTRRSLLPRDESTLSSFNIHDIDMTRPSTALCCESSTDGPFRAARLSSSRPLQATLTKRVVKKQNFVLRSITIKKVSSITKLFATKKATPLTAGQAHFESK